MMVLEFDRRRARFGSELARAERDREVAEFLTRLRDGRPGAREVILADDDSLFAVALVGYPRHWRHERMFPIPLRMVVCKVPTRARSEARMRRGWLAARGLLDA
jgi:hypothetical protein